MMEFRGDWVERGPALSDLIEKETKSDFSKKNEVALLICGMKGRLGILEKQLGILEKQTYRAFDIIIASPDDMELPKTSYQTISLKLKQDYGAAASFYAAEKYISEKGYKYVIEADDDCHPADERLVESLVTGAEKSGFALPHVLFEGFSKPVKSGIIRYFGCISTGLFRKCGYTYIPFMMFGDDLEITGRLKKIAKPAYVAETVVHPTPAYLSLPLDRYCYYVRNGIVTELAREQFFLKKIINLAIRICSFLCYSLVLKMHGYDAKSSRTTRAIVDALALRFRSEDGGDKNEFYKNQEKADIDCFFAQEEYGTMPGIPNIRIKKQVKMGGQFSLSPSFFAGIVRLGYHLLGSIGKNTMVVGRISTALGPFLIVLSKKTFILSKNEAYCFERKDGNDVARALLFLLVLPLLGAASMLLCFLMLLKDGTIKSQTSGYGID